MDNEASLAVKTWMLNNNIEYKLATVDNHRTNVAERCIETAKHHIIAGLATTDENFPIQQWNKLIPQAQHTLNMLRPTQINPKISAFTFLEGQHSYDAVSFAPPGWKVLVFEDPTRRKTWDPHGVEGFHIGPALEHYRNYACYIPSTSSTRITNTVAFFPPQHYTLPTKPRPEELLIEAARELGKAMKAVAHQNPVYPTLEPFQQLERITDLVKDARNVIAPDENGLIQVHTPSTTTPQHIPPDTHLIPNDDDEIDPPPPRVKATPPRVAKKPWRDDIFGRILEPTQHQYPTRHKVNHINENHTEALPPYFVNAIVDYNTGELAPIAYAALHGIIGERINAVIDEKTGQKKEYRHVIQDEGTREVWGFAMHCKLGRLMKGTKAGIVGTETMAPIRKKFIPKD